MVLVDGEVVKRDKTRFSTVPISLLANCAPSSSRSLFILFVLTMGKAAKALKAFFHLGTRSFRGSQNTTPMYSPTPKSASVETLKSAPGDGSVQK